MFVDVHVTLGGQQEYVGTVRGAVEVFWGIGVEEYLECAWMPTIDALGRRVIMPYWLYFYWDRDPQAVTYDLVVYKGTGFDVPIEIIRTDGDLFDHHDPEWAGHIVVADSVVVSLDDYAEIGYDGLRMMAFQRCGYWWGLARPIYAPAP